MSMRALAGVAGALVVAAGAVVWVALHQPDAPRPDVQPRRIISLSPALTDMLFRMGVGDQVVGISKFATKDYGRPVVGDTITLNVETVVGLQPTHILIQQQITGKLELLRDRFGIEVIDCRTSTLAEVRATLLRLGELTHTDAGRRLVDEIDRDLEAVRQRVAGLPRPRVLLAMSVDRVRTAGRDTFVSELLEIAGAENAVGDAPVRYPLLNKEQVIELAPDIIIDVASELADQDYNSPAMIRRRSFWQTLGGCPAVETGRVYVVQNARLTIPGAHVPESARALAELIHPNAFRSEGP